MKNKKKNPAIQCGKETGRREEKTWRINMRAESRSREADVSPRQQ